ncbi:hypothetical protein HL033_02415 [Neoehrlichia mikurensis]|uniref:Uncharacterized protein n=1 Tax=Neoehrlichia mikurensis TaxID=89586 RepID=A0A9Q9BT27_9RICK|nr:hypothetical protein [Neoehrlichia mikurensis]QXK91617.1 hypothetical protein IAH97_02410 [Neoehrlichia mikurensis]QXK92828.1 hypothetical protein HUN61_02405 [Neoehrlichia mikurensis]QXK93308.1 hypothetical protein HL033_02415 [Neoehrlichia mikurensis]UTO55750.1 hypothetical protein LUA82_01575 [Neoehrlichia mikurensis]UTO56667.1 hypothetical protein LUA81_01565 [Neoehrlichia mikurensis]
MSVHLIVDIAFCVGFMLVFNPAKKIITQFLSKRSKNANYHIEESLKVENQLQSLLNNVLTRSKSFENEAELMLSIAREKHNSIIENTKQDIELILENHLELAVNKITHQVEQAIKHLRLAASDIAVHAIQHLLKEHTTDKKHNSEITASATRDLRKKLH